MNVPLTMVGVLKCVPTRMDPLCAAVELDSPWPVMDEAAMVSMQAYWILVQAVSRGKGSVGLQRRGNGEKS